MEVGKLCKLTLGSWACKISFGRRVKEPSNFNELRLVCEVSNTSSNQSVVFQLYAIIYLLLYTGKVCESIHWNKILKPTPRN